jgi:toxin YoeB
MDDVIFHAKAFKEYTEWQAEDHKTLKKINSLIKDIQRNGLTQGVGKPEPLKYIKAYSRRIDDANRLVYFGDKDNNLHIIARPLRIVCR